MFAFTREDMLRAIELGVIGLLTLIVLLTVVRPLLKQITKADSPVRYESVPAPGGGMQQIPVITDESGQTRALAGPAEPETPSERMLALAQIKGQIKAQSVEKIGQMVRQNPSDSVAVVRSWVHEQPATAA